jgi:hypothetical protein
MRWQRLFDDLEAQIEAADAAELEAEVADRIRSEVGRLRMVDRLRGSLGEEIDVHLPSGVRERGVLTRVGADWLLLEPGAAQAGVGEMDALVPLRAVQTLGGLAARSMAPGSEGAVASRLTFASALRQIARDRARVQLTFVDGTSRTGVVRTVGVDFLEVSDEAARSSGAALVATAALTSVRRSAYPGV